MFVVYPPSKKYIKGIPTWNWPIFSKSCEETYGSRSCMNKLFFIYLIYLYVCRKIFEVKFYNGGTSDTNDVANKSINTRYNYDEKKRSFYEWFSGQFCLSFLRMCYEC